jgi:hypothetical protein
MDKSNGKNEAAVGSGGQGEAVHADSVQLLPYSTRFSTACQASLGESILADAAEMAKAADNYARFLSLRRRFPLSQADGKGTR